MLRFATVPVVAHFSTGSYPMDLSDLGRVLVTGSSGFVGSAVARLLIAEGASVRLILRPTSSSANITGLDAEIVRGDLRDRAAVQNAMTGISALFHVAADYRMWVPEPEEIIQNNREMTQCVMEAALASGVKRVVYTSSVATLEPFTDGRSSDETRPLTEETAVGAYKRSKVIAERLVEKLIAERGLPAVIVNPSAPIGPRDIRPTPTGRMVLEAASGRIPAYVATGLNLAHVADVAAGHLAAYRKGRVGERYVLGGQNVELKVLLNDIARLVGKAGPRIRLPRRLLFPFAYGGELFARWTGREPMATVDGLRMARYYMYFSSAKAERELGYTARPYIDALSDAIAWFRAQGRLS
jgi:dihydroflavonol-4-reductase